VFGRHSPALASVGHAQMHAVAVAKAHSYACERNRRSTHTRDSQPLAHAAPTCHRPRRSCYTEYACCQSRSIPLCCCAIIRNAHTRLSLFSPLSQVWGGLKLTNFAKLLKASLKNDST
jgi:hypothetical protein